MSFISFHLFCFVLWYRIATDFEQFIWLHENDQKLFGIDTEEEDFDESYDLDQLKSRVPIGKPSIKPKVKFYASAKKVKKEFTASESNENVNFLVPSIASNVQEALPAEANSGFVGESNDKWSSSQCKKRGKKRENSKAKVSIDVKLAAESCEKFKNVKECDEVLKSTMKPAQRKRLAKANPKTATKKQPIQSNKSKENKNDLRARKTADKRGPATQKRLQTDEKSIKCGVCFKEFACKNHLKSHMRTHKSKCPFNCSNCRRGFTVKSEWESHESKCNRKHFECELCGYFTLYKINIIRHMRTHGGELPFGCEICAKRFAQRTHYKAHMRIHSKEFLPFHCKFCRQGFSLRIKKHFHEMKCNRRRFECYLCDYKSVKRIYLTAHMQHHTGVKPFQCPQCKKQFTRQIYLNNHMKTIHSNHN